MKTVIAFLILFISASGYAQSNLNHYKYIIVPKKFEAFKNVNEYQTSTLIKYLFTGHGFTTVYDDALPNDLKLNRCLGLMTSVQDDSNLFTTKLTIVLKDCNGLELFRTVEGTSKEKQYKKAYNQALTKAMQSFNNVNYVYAEKKKVEEPITVSFKNDIKKLDELKTVEGSVMESKEEGKKPTVSATVTQIATQTTQYYKDVSPVDSTIKIGKQEKPSSQKLNNINSVQNDIWYAQTAVNGFQLVDSTPTIRMLKSSMQNVFIAQTDTKNGIVYLKDGVWVFEFYENDKLVKQQLNIKF